MDQDVRCIVLAVVLQRSFDDPAFGLSHVTGFEFFVSTKHRRVSMENVKILGRRYKSDFKRRISESLFIKQLKPDLNKQKDAFKLKLYN